jgi:hypothetical protein
VGQIGGVFENLQEITTALFSHLIMIKMLHFQSSKYGAHKALDEYYDSFNEKMDRFLEVLQGERGRISLMENTINVSVELATDTDVFDKLDMFKYNVLLELVNSNYSNNLGLISIRDEMIADVDQLKYLLTFK